MTNFDFADDLDLNEIEDELFLDTEAWIAKMLS